MNSIRRCIRALSLLLSLLTMVQVSHAQTVYGEDFTGTASNNDWYFFNGACLTAGTGAATTSPGPIPACTTSLLSYYASAKDADPSLVGGNSGYLGSSTAPASRATQVRDPAGSGALRFTNGYPYGHNESGAIVSKDTFDTGQGIQVTFKTITYRGDSGGAGADGADGISFYLMDGSKPAGIGAFGGSLAYSCSNANAPYDGLNGGYLGLGIDEYGNFLNGSSLMSGYVGTNVATSDNAALGYGYKPGRIGLRGGGSVSWTALTTAYGSNPRDSTKPYYPASLASSCTAGSYDAGTGKCPVCAAGTYNSSSGSCGGICASGTYNPVSGTCQGAAPMCATGDTYDAAYSACEDCPSGYSYLMGTQTCKKGTTTKPVSSSYAPSYATPTTAAPSSYGTLYSLLAVKNTCSTGNLYNYATVSTPSNAGAATLSNSANTAKILDYAPIPNAYKELSGVQIAKESAIKRSDGTPIFYNLKITQDGLLSLSYSISGGAYQSVIKNQSITAANGPLPPSFRFGFAGSTGGSTNIHEIMCFKAASADTSGSSATVNEKQAAKVEAGTQAYFAFYNPNNWTGRLTANNLLDNAGVVTVQSNANWDAACVLSGTSAGNPATSNGGCDTTGVSGPTAAQSPGSRTMLSWSGTAGIPFRWGNLSSSQQSTLDAGDALPINTNRLNYLRGERSNEINSSGSGLYRARDGVLGDIVDSSPIWVGPPNSPYTATWKDRLYTSTTMPENASGKSYNSFVKTAQTRLNVVYGGANDGFLHGFRAGSFDNSGKFVDNSTTPNDGNEVLSYMPGAVLQTIHNSADSSLDYANTQYGHNFFVDATPGVGELFYGGAWHSWLVGGLGIGGAAIYALDVTDPGATNFTESNAANLVVGEWSAANLACNSDTSTSFCNTNLGNTFGTPQIRRLHNGNWGVIFGNGFGSSSGDAGIYVMTVDPSSGSKTFYYLSTGKSGGNGIAYATPADLDGDHITDYVYAGDLKGNVWRFDLTSNDPSNWAAAAAPLFTTPSGQPITSQLLAISAVVGGGPRMLIEFGTGQRTQLTNTAPVAFASGTQGLYGVWDWNLNAWNAKAPGAQYLSLAAGATGLSAPYTVGKTNLQAQTFTITPAGDRDGSGNAICWQGNAGCSSGSFGWYASLPGGNEQIIFNPVFYQGAFIVDSTVPANNIPTSCNTNLDTGFTYAISAADGSVFSGVFPKNKDNLVAGTQTDATGSVYIVTTAEGTTNLIYQTVTGKPGTSLVKLPANTKAKRLTWIELR